MTIALLFFHSWCFHQFFQEELIPVNPFVQTISVVNFVDVVIKLVVVVVVVVIIVILLVFCASS
jgi:hypothetical protein